ncbi:MAG: hypothetical protein N3A53_01615 [Verrucomicrobiae bacterium]|nr:hypothetical protein [Verrucomicrobiae bacterium]
MNYWFSRHDPTPEQVMEMGTYQVVRGADIEIRGRESLIQVAEILNQVLHSAQPGDRLYGVFPPVIRAIFQANPWDWPHDPRHVEVWEAWNVERGSEHGAKTFRHHKFVRTGQFVPRSPQYIDEWER